MGTPAAQNQWIRFAQLVVSGATSGIDLSALRFKFEVRANDYSAPNTLVVRVYNLSPHTLSTLLQKTPATQIAPPPPDQTLADIANNPDPGQMPAPYTYNTCTLVAGYEKGNQGTIFRGDIVQYMFGRESNVDSFLELSCADGDSFYNGAVVAMTRPAGTTDSQSLADIAANAEKQITLHPYANTVLQGTGGTVPSVRGKTSFGLAREALSIIANNNNCRWSIQQGVLTLVPNTGYLPGTPIPINSASGMIGTPTATGEGIIVRCLLNPLIQVGQRIQINNADIIATEVALQGQFPNYGAQYYPATVTNDGIYRVLVVEHIGDTRGTDFYTEMTCLAVDPSSPAGSSVSLAG